MKVPNHQLKSWKLKRQHSDITAIHNASGISRMALTRAFKLGRADEKTIKAIQKFYKTRKAA